MCSQRHTINVPSVGDVGCTIRDRKVGLKVEKLWNVEGGVEGRKQDLKHLESDDMQNDDRRKCRMKPEGLDSSRWCLRLTFASVT